MDFMEKEIFVGRTKVLVIRKNIKNMYLRVCPPEGDVRVNAPIGCTDAQIAAFVQAKTDWIIRQQERIRRHPAQAEHRYETGELFYVWGAPCRFFVIAGERKSGTDAVKFSKDSAENRWMAKADADRMRQTVWLRTRWGAVARCGNALYMETTPDAAIETRKKLLTEWYRKQMQQAVPAVLTRCESRMGLHAGEWHIRDMKTRWGTCNIRERRIWLSLHLAKYPPQCLECVITHELVHLLERGHNRRFYHFMDQFYPDWRTVKKILAERKD